MFLTTLTIIVIIIILLSLDTLKPKGFPPGPSWLPLVGNYFLIRKLVHQFSYHHQAWQHLKSKYGEVVGLRLGRTKFLIVSGVDAINEMLSKDEFINRPNGFVFKLRTFGKSLGLVFANGNTWQVQRRHTITSLRNFGYGQNVMHNHIIAESHVIVEQLQAFSKNGAIELSTLFDIPTLNIIWAILTNSRFEIGDERPKRLLSIMHELFRFNDMSGGLLNQMPFLRHIVPVTTGYLFLREKYNEIYKFLEETISVHWEIKSSDSPRNFIEEYVQRIENNASNLDSTFTKEQLLSACLDIFFASSETTSATIGFSLLYMLRYPNIQTLVQNELDTVIGRNRWPELQDRINLPYTQAVLIEIQRVCNIAPEGVPRRPVCDTVFRGYRVDKDTVLIPNLIDLHTDEKIWGPNAKQFQPERHLTTDGKLCRPSEDIFKPFGFGPRRCFGEGLAKASFFIFFVTILHNFKLETSSDHPLLPRSCESFDGSSSSPKPFYGKLIPRM